MIGQGTGIELQLGRGTHRVCVRWHGRGAWLLRVPFLGKAWRYGQERGAMGWGAVRAEGAELGD